MKNFLIITGALILLLIAFVTGMKFGQNQLQQEYKALVGLNSEKYAQLSKQSHQLKQSVKVLEDSIVALQNNRQAVEAVKGKDLAKLRKNKPVNVPVTNIQWAECDSAKAVGHFYKIEAETRQVQIDSCKEAVAVQDTALMNMEAELIGADLRHKEDQKAIGDITKTAEEERNRKVIWRRVTGIFGITIVALLLIS